MSYFIKKTLKNKGLYLQIYDSSYDASKGYAVQKSYRALGYEKDLIEEGIESPLEFFQFEVDELNKERLKEKKAEKFKEISDVTPEKHLGYFLLKSINDSLGLKGHIDLLQSSYPFKCCAYDALSSLIYARVIEPCSKHRTFYEVLPKLFEKTDFSEDQMYGLIEFFGWEYEKIIEIYNNFISKKFGFDTSSTYFDCTNFYFEIDREDSLRRKGPSKERRSDPIVGMGLLLDKNQIPIGMRIFPGNQSEKPMLQEIIRSLKETNSIEAKTIRIADKGLNSASNIYEAICEGDGYIFSKSVKMLPQIEKTWVLIDDYKDVFDEKGNLLYSIKECTDDFPYEINDKNGKKRKISLREKRVVSYSPALAKKQRAEINKQVERAKRLRLSEAKRGEYGDSAKFVNFRAVDDNGEKSKDKIAVSINHEAVDEALALAGYNMFVTSETHLSALYIKNTYHNLWRIEESFRVMKSYLDARPVFLQKKESIIGHFLICYLSVVLIRLLQFKVLEDHHSSEEIIDFIRETRLVKQSANKYINISRNSEFTKLLAKNTQLPITHYYLSNTQIKKMLNHRF